MRALDYSITVGPLGTKEADCFICAHCQRITMLDARSRPDDAGGHCKVCDKLICKHCLGKGCRPWEKEMERMEARYLARKSYEECA